MAFNKLEQSTGLCDIAIVVVDIVEGLKPQAIESIELPGIIEFLLLLLRLN